MSPLRIPRLALAIAACAVLAGIGLYVWDQWDETWLPPGPPEAAGRILFERKRCVRCHRIAGTGGLVGPDLTAVAFKHEGTWFGPFLDDPKAIDPNARMPRPRLTPEQREALVAYLGTLDGTPPKASAAAQGR